MYYMRAIGANKYGAGTDKWLKIKTINKNKDGTYVLQGVIRGNEMWIDVDPSVNIRDLRFAKGYPGLMPVSFKQILQNF